MENPYVSIIIPAYQDLTRLSLCLAKLKSQSYPADCFEVIVVNNGACNDLDELEMASNSKIIHEPKPGSYSARNAGINIAKGEIVGFTDSDCVPSESWIENAVEEFQSCDGIDRVTGPVELFREDGGSWLAWKYEAIVAFNQKYNVSKGLSVTANLFVNAKLFESVGLFDSNLFSGGDMAWNLKASQLGCNIKLCEGVIVEHPARRSLFSLIEKSRRVTGGGWQKTKQSKKSLTRFVVQHFIPPVRFAYILIKDGKPLWGVLYAFTVFWVIKLLMVLEIFRLMIGGKQVR